MEKLDYYGKYPTDDGRFGIYGGAYVPETLVPAINELKEAYARFKEDPEFISELDRLRKDYAGRPTPLTFATNLSKALGCKIYLKREDLLHGGAHKLNNTLGQALLARLMGKQKLIAETGAGQHGFATAIVGAYFGMETKIFMGAVDIERQAYNVNRMRILGAEIVPVNAGSRTLKEATSEALRYWTSHVADTHYLIGSVVGPHPYPMIVRDMQRVIGREIKEQVMAIEGKLPRGVVACVGGGSNAMGAFYDLIEDPEVELWGVEAAGEGIDTGKHAASLNKGTEGILHGAYQLLLQDHERNVLETHSISAGLDYPGVGPELCHLKDIGRLSLASAMDAEALDAFFQLSRSEGIIPALESSHAVAFANKLAKEYSEDDVMVINISGSGGKDMDIVMKERGLEG
ncbi:MAG TPA: tryptophan synthase subunit beta [Candidatus Lokiarchaeia archaeon]|nr:tryptophan synthase subunit beta [Candidatus Lokiarchaeia archaeon]